MAKLPRGGKSIASIPKSILYNRYVLYFVFAIAVGNIVQFMMQQDHISVLLMVVVGLLTSFFSKNMVVIMVVALVVANVLKYGTHLRVEGFKSDKDEDDEEDDEEEMDMEDMDEEDMEDMMKEDMEEEEEEEDEEEFTTKKKLEKMTGAGKQIKKVLRGMMKEKSSKKDKEGFHNKITSFDKSRQHSSNKHVGAKSMHRHNSDGSIVPQ
jgi:hypothetical protein